MADLPRMRFEYEAKPLSARDLDADPFVEFGRWLSLATEAGVHEPNATVLSSVDEAGQPWSRFVLLKGFSDAGFEIYTNYGSFKSQQMAAAGKAALTFGWLDLHRQVNIAGLAEKVADADSDAYWAVRPRGSQLGGWASEQSAPVAGRAEIEARYREAEQRFPGEVPRPEFWGGWRIVPHTIEFWNGHANRLHDRFRYTRGDGWSVERLMP